jgi:hypothetical protein
MRSPDLYGCETGPKDVYTNINAGPHTIFGFPPVAWIGNVATPPNPPQSQSIRVALLSFLSFGLGAAAIWLTFRGFPVFQRLTSHGTYAYI